MSDYEGLCDTYGIGVAVGDEREFVAFVSSMSECVHMVRGSGPRANGASMTNPSMASSDLYVCYREIGQTSLDESQTGYVNCVFPTGPCD